MWSRDQSFMTLAFLYEKLSYRNFNFIWSSERRTLQGYARRADTNIRWYADDIICLFACEKDADEFFYFFKLSSSQHKVVFRKEKR